MKISRQLTTVLSAMALNLAFLTPGSQAANQTWSGAGSDSNWSTGANWAGTAPANNDNLLFNGTANQSNNNDITSLTAGYLQFNNGGFALTGKALTLNPTTAGIFTNAAGTNLVAVDLVISPQNKTMSLAAGSELQFSGALTNSQTVNPLFTVVGGGTLRITSPNFQPQRFFTVNNGTIILDGAYASAVDGYRLNPAAAGQTTATILTNNAVLRLGSGGNLRLGQNAVTGGTGLVQVNISSGKLELYPSATAAGNINLGEQSGVTATFTQSGGLVWGNPVNLPNDTSTCKLVFGNSSATANGTYNLNGGTLSVRQIVQVTSGATAVFNFNGGTLLPISSSTTFFQGIQTANVQDGGAVIDSTNFNITIGQSLLKAGTGVGGLTKIGNGTLTLTGANTYGGTTLVNKGALVTTVASVGAGAYSVADGATLEVQVTGAGKSLTNSSLTLGTSGALTNNFILGANASTSIPAVVVNGALNLNGTVNVNVTGTGLTAPNTYVLMSYGSLSGSGSFVAGTMPSVVGYVASLVNDTTANQLKLVYAPAPTTVKWAVGDGAWDTSSLNWTLLTSTTPTPYVEGSPAVFDDSASGSSPITVTLSGNRTPSSITNDSTKTYILSGSSILSSPVTKNGSGTLVIANGAANTLASVTINAGTVQLGNNDASGSLGANAIADSGTLAFNRTDSLTIANVISGSGGVNQNGTGTLTLSAANSYLGTTLVNAGTLVIGNSTALGATTGAAVVQNGATLNISGVGLGLKPISVAGTLLNLGSDQNDASANISLTGDATLGGSGLFGVRTGADTDPGFVANGYKFTKIGTGQFNINGGKVIAGLTKVWGTDVGDVDIQQGILSFQRRASLGYSTNTIAIYPGAELLLYSLNQAIGVQYKNISLTNGIIESSGGSAGDINALGGPITVTGSTNILRSTAGTILSLQGPVIGSGNIQYSGLVTLAGTNTYTGNTYVANGTLTIAATGLLTGSTNLSIASSATFDVSAIASYVSSDTTALNLSSGAIIKGGTVVNLGAAPVSLTFAPTAFTGDLSHPSLTISQGNLNLSGVVSITNNGASPLGAGIYTLVAATTGTLSGTPVLNTVIQGQGLAVGTLATLQVSGKSLNLVVQQVTTTTLNPVASPVGYGTPVALTATVSPASAAGTVNFMDGTTLLGSGTLSGGTAGFTTTESQLQVSSHSLTAVYSGDAASLTSSSDVATVLVSAKTLTITGLTAENKVDDGTLSATITGTPVLVGSIGLDDVSLVGTPLGTFQDATVATVKPVTVSGLSLAGLTAGNYVLQPLTLSADITVCTNFPPLTVVSEAGDVLISWPASEQGVSYSAYQLKGSDLTTPATWEVQGTPELSGGRYAVKVSTTNSMMFFRLVK